MNIDPFRVWSTTWRSGVIIQTLRLERELGAAQNAVADQRAEVRAAIDAAKESACRRVGPLQWWTGSEIETAWSNLQAAQELLIGLQSDSELAARLPYLQSVTAGRPIGSKLSDQIAAHPDGKGIDRDIVREAQAEHNVDVDIQHQSIRQFRNRILGVTVLLAIGLASATLAVSNELRVVMGIGALAGLLTTVLTLTNAKTPSGPYGVAGVQAMLKVPAGAATALLAVLLLRNGAGALKPATGSNAWFYAVIFGFSQQAFTQLVDNQAKNLVGGAQPRSVTQAASKPTSSPT